MRQKIAIMKKDKTSWHGKEFVCFDEVEYNTQEEKQKKIDEAVNFFFECECDVPYCEGDGCDECQECDAFGHECDCEYWSVEVSGDTISYDSYEQEFRTQEDLDRIKKEQREERVRRLVARNQAIEKEIEKLQKELLTNKSLLKDWRLR